MFGDESNGFAGSGLVRIAVVDLVEKRFSNPLLLIKSEEAKLKL